MTQRMLSIPVLVVVLVPVLVLVLVLGGCASGGYQAPASWTEPLPPFEIADGLHYVGTAGLAAYLLTSDDGHVLIDAPMEENVELVLANIEALGFEPTDVGYLVASHAHFDHVGGLAAVRMATGAELLLSAADAAIVAGGGSGPLGLGEPYPPVEADGPLDHLQTVELGGRALVAHLTPGHTPGCTSWSGEVEIDGETLTFVSVCSLSVLPSYQLVGDGETYPGIAADFCASVAHLRTLSADIFLASHPIFYDMEEKRQALLAGSADAFVDPDGYMQYLDQAEARIEETLAEQGETGGCAAVFG